MCLSNFNRNKIVYMDLLYNSSRFRFELRRRLGDWASIEQKNNNVIANLPNDI